MSEILSPSQQVANADDPVRTTKALIEKAVAQALEEQSRKGVQVVDPRQDPNFRSHIDRIQSPMGAVRQGLRGVSHARTLAADIVRSEQFSQWAKTPAQHRGPLSFSLQSLMQVRTQAAGYDDINEASGALAAERQPEFVGYPTTPRQLRDIMQVVPTDGSSIVYYRETGFTRPAGMIAPAVEAIDPASAFSYPQSQITGEVVTEPVKRIGTFLPIPRVSLEDLPALENQIASQLIPALYDEETAQYLSGNGLGDNALGLMSNPLCQTYSQSSGDAGDNEADAILKAMALIWVAKLMPDAAILHPTNHANLMKRKDDFGRYLFGSPTDSSILSQLWGLPLLVLLGQTVGVGSVGAFNSAARIRDRQQADVVFVDSVGTDRLDGIVRAVAEMRTALENRRPEAFAKVTFDGAPLVS